MPKGFDMCVKKGGRVRTIKPKGKKSNVYLHVCYLGKKAYPGEVKRAKTPLARQLGKSNAKNT